MLKRTSFLAVVLSVVACGGSTAPTAARYNFAVIDGKNQISTAGDPTVAKPITSEITRDAAGKFALRDRVLDFLLPVKAFAQSIKLSGTPVAGVLVCAQQSGLGEPQAVPLCATTLPDGTAPITIKGGTKAGVYNFQFTAQVQTQLPVKDSTTVTVKAGAMATNSFQKGNGFVCWTVFPEIDVLDQFGNAVPYRFATTGTLAHVGSDVLGSSGARTFIADKQSLVLPPIPPARDNYFEYQSVTVETANGVIATGKLTVPNLGAGCVNLDF